MLLNERGEVVRLGAHLTTPGGEGVIYQVTSDPSCVAKLYHAPPHGQRTAKLRYLCRAGNAGLLDVAAWPRSLLYATGDKTTVRGFIMPRIEGKEIHKLYGPRDRHLEFPSAAWDFLLRVARNCAAAFETLHENGVVMADVNEKNLLVTTNGLVRLIDCDSYQICNGNHRFLCDVGVPLWTAPELQMRVRQRGYHGLERTPSHDRFGLAVLIFELLFMGRHPFAGVPDGLHRYELQEAIERYLFAFGAHGRKSGVRAPPHTLPLGALPEGVVGLFERAFLPGSERPNARPTGREWADELDSLYAARKTCNYDPGHKYWNGLTSCPWCQIASGGGPNFFIAVAIHLGAPGVVVDVSAFWATIERIAAGALMRKSVAPLQLPVAGGRPMPMPRPVSLRVIKPQPPSQQVLPTLRPLPPPPLPGPPELASPAQLPKLPLGHGERDVRASILGIVLFGIGCSMLVCLGLTSAALVAGAETVAFLLAWARKSPNAAAERKQRTEAERQARVDERKQAEAEYERQAAEHAVKAKQVEKEYARAVAEAEAARAREQSRLEAEYRSQLSAYTAQLRLFETAWAKFQDEKRRWESECDSRAKSVEQTRREMNDTWERLSAALANYQSRVRDLKRSVEPAYHRLQKASEDEATEIRALEAKKREAQLRQYLDAQLIRNHHIDRVRSVDKATLVANGIESALDISWWMKKVPGIGDKRRESLLAWRARCEAAFRFNPKAPLPEPEVQAVRFKYAQAKQHALVEVRGGAGTLSALESEAQRVITTLEARLPQLARGHAQALADHRECS